MSQNIWAWELQITERKVNKLKNERKFNLFNEVLNDVSETHTDSYENNVWKTHLEKKYLTLSLDKVHTYYSPFICKTVYWKLWIKDCHICPKGQKCSSSLTQILRNCFSIHSWLYFVFWRDHFATFRGRSQTTFTRGGG